jgi:transposase-like protein
MKSDQVDTGTSDWHTFFDDRYGADAYERLIAELRQPCVTFAAIAQRLGVTRERVRQWQLTLLPDAPRGHERRRRCAVQQRRRLLLQDPLFRDFYRHARTAMAADRIELVIATDRYRRRLVRIDRRVIALRTARPRPSQRRPAGTSEYRLASYRGGADFVYYRLTGDEYLLIPAHHLRARETRFVDVSAAGYGRFKNTFAALDGQSSRPGQMPIEERC